MTTDDDPEDTTIKMCVLRLVVKGDNSFGAYGAKVGLLIIRSSAT